MNTQKRTRGLLSIVTGLVVGGFVIASVPAQSVAAPAAKGGTMSDSSAFPIKKLQQAVDADDVRVVKTVETLPPAIRERFKEYVRDPKTGQSTGKQIDMANRGQSWNAGCMRMPGQPSRMLGFAGITRDKCFVVFYTGGFATRQHIALFDLSKPQMPLISATGVSSISNDLAELKKMVHSEKFHSTAKSAPLSL